MWPFFGIIFVSPNNYRDPKAEQLKAIFYLRENNDSFVIFYYTNLTPLLIN